MQKPRLSFWQIWNMSFGFLGIQFGWGLQLANMSPIYKYLHAEESSLPYLWLAGPITGLIIQPIIGSMSDRTGTGSVGAVLISSPARFSPVSLCSSCLIRPCCGWLPDCFGSSTPASTSRWNRFARLSPTSCRKNNARSDS